MDENLNNNANNSFKNPFLPEEYKSKTSIFGIPLVHICQSNEQSDKIKMARGIIAIGNSATGIIAIGGSCIGIFTFGGISLGLVSIGGISFGFIFSMGFFSVGWISTGIIAIGYYAVGLFCIGMQCLGFNSASPQMIEIAKKYFSFTFNMPKNK